MKNVVLLAILALPPIAQASINTVFFAPLDVQKIHDQEVVNQKKGVAPRFAIPKAVSIRPENWIQDGQNLKWSYEVTAPNAVSLNFGFKRFSLPEGANLDIYSSDRTQFVRSFTSEDNNIHKELWSPVIMSDRVIVEVTVPSEQVSEVDLEISQVGIGFRTFSQSTLKSGSCNIDVACSDSKGWEDEVKTVGVISTGGSTFCTGFMVNNTRNDRTPFFMTANHCRVNAGNAASLVVYWNYQTSSCKGSRDGKLNQFQTGSVHLASHSRSDFTLVKLLSQPKAAWDVRYAGWDATGDIGSPAVAIHHPNTDEKSISFENDPTVLSSYGGQSSPGDSTHVRVIDWDKGTTEPGSSGSPLFDQNHRVIGQLHGGGAACGNDLSDYYGRFYTSWNGTGSPNTSLKTHLDPDGTGRLTTDTL
jgi:lysyl endopeptidase